MKQNFIDVIGEWIEPNGNLYNKHTPHVDYQIDKKEWNINLDGNFTADELRALAKYMDPESD